MTKSALLLSTGVALVMAFGGSAAGAKNVAGFMSRGPTNAHLPAVPPVTPRTFSNKAKVVARYERGFTTYSYYKNVSAISNPSSGVYCIYPSVPLVYGSISVQITPEWALSLGFSFVDFWETGNFGDCGSNSIEVRTYDTSGNLTEESAFNLSLN
jgi:hypothetical protein